MGEQGPGQGAVSPTYRAELTKRPIEFATREDTGKKGKE